MTNKIVAISDLHLGQSGADGLGQHSLLSSKFPQNLVDAFARAIAAYTGSESYTLLVVGDVLDLSLGYAEDALADLRDLLTAISTRARPDEIVYVVGNHDHHLWSLHSEDKRLLGPLRAGQLPERGSDPRAKAMYQVTPPSGEPFKILQPLVDRICGEGRTKVTIAYPSYSRDLAGGSILYATHGHLIGGLYTELSDLLKDKLAGLPHDHVAATVNHPIVEFIYWLIGETGEGLGADGLVEEIYTDLQKGRDGRVRSLIASFVEQLLPHGVLWRVIGGLERRLVVDAIMKYVDEQLPSPPLKSVTSADRFADVAATREKLVSWLSKVTVMNGRDMPSVKTIVLYGHTHVRDDYQIPGTGAHSHNLGTWLVEPNHDKPKTGFLGIDGNVATWNDVA